MKATITLEGDPNEINAVISMAVNDGLLQKMTLDDVAPSTNHRQPRRVRNFSVGDRVKVVTRKGEYEVNLNDCGVVTKILMGGKGAKRTRLAIRWDDNSESEIPGSALEVIKRA